MTLWLAYVDRGRDAAPQDFTDWPIDVRTRRPDANSRLRGVVILPSRKQTGGTKVI